jgi:hypothetical protein
MSSEQELDQIKMEYLEAREAGRAPTLEEVVARHPHYRSELVDFITTCIEVERALERVPEPLEPSAATSRQREAAVRLVCGAETLPEALAGVGVSREEAAATINVPVTFILRIEQGRLLADDDEPVDFAFLTRLGEMLRRTADEVLEILQVTSENPARRRNPGHAHGTGRPGANVPSPPQPFRALLAGCEDLTEEQRREWLGEDSRR